MPPKFVTRIKRLLEIDLKWARIHGQLMLGFSMAFYDELPLGTDHEVQYSPYRVLNLTVALELVRFGGKQGEVVDLIAQIQGDLSLAFDEANSARPSSERTNVLAIKPSSADSSASEKRGELQIYLALRRVEVTPRGAEYPGEPHSVSERIFDRKLLRGREALHAYIATEVCDSLLDLFVLELSELAVRITFRAHSYDSACARNDVEHRLTKPRHPWTNGQVERMNRTIKEATVRRYNYDDHQQLRWHLEDFIDAYNYGCRLKTRVDSCRSTLSAKPGQPNLHASDSTRPTKCRDQTSSLYVFTHRRRSNHVQPRAAFKNTGYCAGQERPFGSTTSGWPL